jgi:hypothetical protein
LQFNPVLPGIGILGSSQPFMEAVNFHGVIVHLPDPIVDFIETGLFTATNRRNLDSVVTPSDRAATGGIIHQEAGGSVTYFPCFQRRLCLLTVPLRWYVLRSSDVYWEADPSQPAPRFTAEMFL